ncbi:hypothetical protein IAR55_003562 [Kwoniella newhampshirensis]|uniref:Sec20 C-terminal domain-containing protein n=1 Tax=Kwoniella newhampshirensis TaxID=1651941 RepID=A0AAW0Z1D4_9TREE
MPPTPSSSTMTNVQPILSSLPRRLADLQTFQLPRLKSCLGPPDLHRELADEMRGDLESVRYNLEAARELSESLSKSEKQDVVSRLDQLDREYQDLRRAYRSATLSSKRAMNAKRSRVHELASASKNYELDESRLAVASGSGTDETGGNKGKARSAAEFGMGGDDELQTKTNEVTTALRRTTALMQTELERSVLSVQMLESSSQTLRSTQSLYDRYGSLLSTSTKLVRTLEKADTLDRILILSALLFFLLVVGFIVKRRVIDRTVGVVVGGVGRGLGWYLWSSGRLINLVLGRGRGRGQGAKDKNMNKIKGPGVDETEMGSDETRVQGALPPLPESSIGQDSAIDPSSQSSSSDLEGVVGDPDPAPADTPYIERGMEPMGKLKGGKVEIIVSDDSERMVPQWVEDTERADIELVEGVIGGNVERTRDEL